MFGSLFSTDSRSSQMLSAIADLQSDYNDVDKKSNALKAQLDQLLSAYHAREETYTAAVKCLQESHEAIIREAEEKAEVLIASAEKASKEMATIAQKEATDLIEQANKQAETLKETAKREREEWEAEKASVADIQTFQPIIKICVGGDKFTTSLTTLTRFPDTMIGAMFSGRHALVLHDEGYHFIDRDGTHFRYVLNFLRSPETFHLDLTGAALKELKTECEYYGLKNLMFPFVPIAAFCAASNYGHSVTVQQDEKGVFSVGGRSVRLCAHCGTAAYDPNYSYYYIAKFRDIVAAKGGVIVDGQPGSGGTCQACGR